VVFLGRSSFFYIHVGMVLDATNLVERCVNHLYTSMFRTWLESQNKSVEIKAHFAAKDKEQIRDYLKKFVPYAEETQWQFISEIDPRYATLIYFKKAENFDFWNVVNTDKWLKDSWKNVGKLKFKGSVKPEFQIIQMVAQIYSIISQGYEMGIVFGAEITVEQGKLLARWNFPWQGGGDGDNEEDEDKPSPPSPVTNWERGWIHVAA
jgi:hypothetical protein